MWSPWSSVTQPGPPRPEHLDQPFSSGDVSSQSGLITLLSLVAIRATYLVSQFTINTEEEGDMGRLQISDRKLGYEGLCFRLRG